MFGTVQRTLNWLAKPGRTVRKRRDRLTLEAFTPRPEGGILVGGAVRDALLGRPSEDWDWIVADPQSAALETAATHGGHAFALDDQRGHWRVVHEEGTFDYVPAGGDLNTNLRARDYTINAVALAGDGLVDPLGGVHDLARGVLRQVSPNALQDDVVRSVRGVRLAAQLNLVWDARTRAAAERTAADVAAGRTQPPAMERLRDELTVILHGPAPGDAVMELHRTGWLHVMLPVLSEGAGVQQGSLHHLDVLEHQCEALQRLATSFPDAPLDVRLATLLHDAGKPACRTVDSDGRVRFQGHAEHGAQQTASALRRLRYSAEVVSRAARLVERHMVRLPDNSRSARRFAHRYQDELPGLLHVMLADREAARGPAASAKARERYRHAVARVVAELETLPEAPPLLRGEDVMQLLNVKPGPWVGAALSFVAESQAVGDIADRDEAERAVKAWWAA